MCLEQSIEMGLLTYCRLLCAECGRTFQENSASFASPSYYSSTPSAEPESCEWRITATHGEKIVLNITDLVCNVYDCT